VSKYFEVLERLDRDKPEAAAAPGPVRAVPMPVPGPDLTGAITEPLPAAEEGPAAADGQGTTRLIEMLRGRAAGALTVRKPRAAVPLKGVDTLFNNLEALTLGKRPLTLVLAGAAASDAVGALAVSLGAYAQEHGHAAVVAELQNTTEGPVVVRRRLRAAHLVSQGSDDRLPIDLHGGTSRELLARWREEASPGAEIMFVIGPPLAESVDSALLASQCDGLIIVAVQEHTSRADLTAAAERARLTQSPTLGVVVDAGRDRRPAWVRRLLGR
jgi:hypothetical protein